MTAPAVREDFTDTFPPESDRAWAAGFFDGEGYTGLAWIRGRPRLRISLAQAKDYASLRRFAEIVGVGKIYGPFQAKNPNWNPQLRLNINGPNVIHALSVMFPYLGDVKLEQALRATYIWSKDQLRGRR